MSEEDRMCVDEVPGRGGVRATLSCRIANEPHFNRSEQRERAGLTSHPSFAVLLSLKNRRAGIQTSELLPSRAAVPERSSRTRTFDCWDVAPVAGSGGARGGETEAALTCA